MNDPQNCSKYNCTRGVDTLKKNYHEEFYDVGGITITGIDECRTT